MKGEHSREHLRTLLGQARLAARREGLEYADAEDVASVALMQYWEVREKVEKPTAWIRLVAKRKAWDHKKRERSQQALVEENARRTLEVNGGEDYSVDTTLDLRAALSTLDSVQLQTLFKRDVEGEPLGVIAHSTGLSRATVKRRLRTARSVLQRALAGQSLRSSFRRIDLSEGSALLAADSDGDDGPSGDSNDSLRPEPPQTGRPLQALEGRANHCRLAHLV